MSYLKKIMYFITLLIFIIISIYCDIRIYTEYDQEPHGEHVISIYTIIPLVAVLFLIGVLLGITLKKQRYRFLIAFWPIIQYILKQYLENSFMKLRVFPVLILFLTIITFPPIGMGGEVIASGSIISSTIKYRKEFNLKSVLVMVLCFVINICVIISSIKEII